MWSGRLVVANTNILMRGRERVRVRVSNEDGNEDR